jgi:hypothetical protein
MGNALCTVLLKTCFYCKWKSVCESLRRSCAGANTTQKGDSKLLLLNCAGENGAAWLSVHLVG